MMRPQDGKLVETPSNWVLYNPIIPYGIIAVNSDGSGSKIGDGINKWADLDYEGDVAIRGKLIQSNRDPLNNELLVFCSSQDKWVYRTQGCLDTETNWAANGTVFPTLTMLVEIDDATSRPTGRFKVSDGVTAFPSIPWFGIFNTSDWPTNYSMEFNGTGFEPAHYIKVDELQMSTNPVGAFHRDDGTFALISDTYVTGDTSSIINNIAVFNDTSGKSIIDSTININDLPASTGTPNTSYQIDTGIGPKLTNISGDLIVYKDDGSTLANLTTNTNTSNYGQFGTVYIGFPTETTSVTLTSDGAYLLVDGGKVFTHLNDGSGSGLDADTLDGKHANQFITVDSALFMLHYVGGIDCSSNPDFPSASANDWYKVINSGLIGGASGVAVATGDDIICHTDSASGDFASVGSNWDVFHNNSYDIYVSGSTTSTNNEIVLFDGVNGNQIKSSGKTLTDIEDEALIYSIVMGG